ncbi:MAG: hypothetical protein IPN69_12860 [Acidobacteria bacterium]|nr:hypothetical protein [Acidobacteriota bacterium]
MADEETKLKYIKAACFGVGIVIGLSLMMFVFGGSGPFAGAIGGICGAMIGMALFSVYVKIRG